MSQTHGRPNGNTTSDEIRDEPAKRGAGDRELRPQDRLTLSETIYLSTIDIIRETRDAIESSLNRLRPQSDPQSGTKPARPSASQSAPEAHSGNLPETTEAESGQARVIHKPDEDPLAQARRHVRQAEGHVARQEALIERLSLNDNHAALAEQAREILRTLRQTLSLAREHLELELKK